MIVSSRIALHDALVDGVRRTTAYVYTVLAAVDVGGEQTDGRTIDGDGRNTPENGDIFYMKKKKKIRKSKTKNENNTLRARTLHRVYSRTVVVSRFVVGTHAAC